MQRIANVTGSLSDLMASLLESKIDRLLLLPNLLSVPLWHPLNGG
jgi:hypothetical protein